MKDVQVSIDRIVVEFTDIYWDFFNPFKLRLRQYLNASLSLKEKGFMYHLHVKDGGHYLSLAERKVDLLQFLLTRALAQK